MKTLCSSQRYLLAGLFVAAFCLGCGGTDETPKFLKNLVPVTGTVTINGKPAVRARVRFIPPSGPDAPQGTHEATGVTDADGKYTLVSPAPRVTLEQATGALPGDYKVVISLLLGSDGKPIPKGTTDADAMAQGAKESLPPQYSNESKTKLKATVSASSDPIDFDLKVRGR